MIYLSSQFGTGSAKCSIWINEKEEHIMTSVIAHMEERGIGIPPLQLAEPIRVLVAEDDEDFRFYLAGELGRAGFHVRRVADGREFLRYAVASTLNPRRFKRPHVVVTDIRMPGHDGLALLSTIREMEWNTPVILMTAIGNLPIPSEHDAVAVFTKPFRVQDLTRVIRSVAGVYEHEDHERDAEFENH
jgi:DNA-binding NtrC family response regulator